MTKLLLVCVLALATVAAGRRTSGKMFDARSWLQAHSRGKDAPDMSDLQELQQTNPDAYALVKALLVKNSLGLIRRKAPSDETTVVDDGSGSAPHQERNFFNWKPADDGAAVSAVLGEVGADVTVAKNENPTPDQDQATAPAVSEGSSSATGAADVFSKGATEAKEATTAQTTSEKATEKGGKDGAFWSGLFDPVSAKKPQQPKEEEAAPAAPVEEEEKPAEVAPPAPKRKKVSAIGQSSSSSPLASFDWNSDDDDDKKGAAPAKGMALPVSNSYAHFLD